VFGQNNTYTTLDGTTDPNIPADFKPYAMYTGIKDVANGEIWVAFYNGTPGAAQGYVDAFDHNGNLLHSLQHSNVMNQPSGIALATYHSFGYFTNAVLVAMTGSGLIAAFNPTTGNFGGYLKRPSGEYLVIPGIRGIEFGNGSPAGGPSDTLYFTAGIYGFTHGLFGSITAK
jgi:uncharacterized protein (TIGR03118 family)